KTARCWRRTITTALSTASATAISEPSVAERVARLGGIAAPELRCAVPSRQDRIRHAQDCAHRSRLDCWYLLRLRAAAGNAAADLLCLSRRERTIAAARRAFPRRATRPL